MGSSIAVVGAVGGALICAVGGWTGARAVLRAAVNDEQREALRQILAWGGSYAAAVFGIVLLTACQVLPHWVYMATIALWFGPLFPALAWAHHRLDAAAGHPHLDTSWSAA